MRGLLSLVLGIGLGQAALCSEHTCATGTKKKAFIDATDDAGFPATTCCEESPDATVTEVRGTMVFTAFGAVENAELGVETMLSKLFRVPMADVEAAATAADQEFTADYVVSFSNLTTATAAHAALAELDSAATATALKAELTAAGVTVPETFSVTKTEEALVSSGGGTTTSGSAEADEEDLSFLEICGICFLSAIACWCCCCWCCGCSFEDACTCGSMCGLLCAHSCATCCCCPCCGTAKVQSLESILTDLGTPCPAAAGR